MVCAGSPVAGLKMVPPNKSAARPRTAKAAAASRIRRRGRRERSSLISSTSGATALCAVLVMVGLPHKVAPPGALDVAAGFSDFGAALHISCCGASINTQAVAVKEQGSAPAVILL